MDRRVVWTEAAWSDLGAAADYIARDSPRYAAAFVREVRDAARTLRHFSERGRTVPEFGQPEFRELLVRSYRLVYTVKADTVYILGFIHGSRDLANWRPGKEVAR